MRPRSVLVQSLERLCLAGSPYRFRVRSESPHLTVDETQRGGKTQTARGFSADHDHTGGHPMGWRPTRRSSCSGVRRRASAAGGICCRAALGKLVIVALAGGLLVTGLQVHPLRQQMALRPAPSGTLPAERTL